MPSYRDKGRKGEKDLWRLKVWLRGNPHCRMFRGSRRDAEAAEARFRLEIEESLHRAEPEAVPKLLAFFSTYLESARIRVRPSWLRNQVYTLATVGEVLGDVPLNEIGVAAIEAYARSRIDAGRSPTTVNNELRVLRRVLAVAVERGHIAAVPRVRPLPEPHRTIDVWSHDDLARLLEATATASKHILGIVVFLANTGCRRGEALALRWEHVDLDRGLVRIWPSAEWQPKSGRPREVPISDALMPWMQMPQRSAYVFPTFHGRGKGGRYAAWPSLAFERAVAAAQLKGTPHTLRHTFAAHFLAARPDLTLLAEILGHSDAAVTRLYKHLLPDHLARARNAVQVVAPAAAAEALALERWRGGRKSASRRAENEPAKARNASGVPKRSEPSAEPSGEPDRIAVGSDEIANDSSGAGYRVRTGDIKLGKSNTRSKILKLLKP